jgi:hypothetical protein
MGLHLGGVALMVLHTHSAVDDAGDDGPGARRHFDRVGRTDCDGIPVTGDDAKGGPRRLRLKGHGQFAGEQLQSSLVFPSSLNAKETAWNQTNVGAGFHPEASHAASCEKDLSFDERRSGGARSSVHFDFAAAGQGHLGGPRLFCGDGWREGRMGGDGRGR